VQTCVGGRVVTQPRKERQSFRFKSKTSRHPLSMDELIALIDSATGHLGGDVRGLTSAYRELQRRLRSRARRRVRDRLFGLLPGAARLLHRGGEGVAGAPRRLGDCDDTPMLSHSMPNLTQVRAETVSASAPSRPARRCRFRSFSAG